MSHLENIIIDGYLISQLGDPKQITRFKFLLRKLNSVIQGMTLTLEIHLSCRTSAAKFYLSHLKFTCPNKPPQYHRITRSYNLLVTFNKEWRFCSLYIYL